MATILAQTTTRDIPWSSPIVGCLYIYTPKSLLIHPNLAAYGCLWALVQFPLFFFSFRKKKIWKVVKVCTHIDAR